ncbi:glutathione reductase (NADPH) [Methylopila jiangsuensis]|uniref:glutathione-disulfide reductase n=1 Tax=Methylopila jiangsuensis TaxID=586230 RepID=UPI0022F2E439|nr:glutathione-disulfide reductase [Methylopila jiangsuensis]MDR6284439.1 glutathione reductase (NADPH) [Methylopila jiangsuensis]
MADYDVDLFVIGAGSGGVRAARIAAGYGARVAIAEDFRVGGTCVIRGCVPKKLYVYASRFADAFEDAAGFGWTVPEATFSWEGLVAAKEKEITRLSGLYAANLDRAGVTLHRQRAALSGPNAVRLADGTEITAGTILIATGGAPVGADIPGAELAISSNEAFDLPRFPETIVIAGGGYIALEFASVFAGLGSKVTLIHRGDKVLRGFDEDVRDEVAEGLRKRGVELVLSDEIAEIAAAGEGRRVATKAGRVIEADQVMLAIGRTPATAGLGLETTNVMTSHAGAILVDVNNRTNVASVYAVGDVTDRVNLTPVAIREGHAFADTVFGNRPTVVAYDAIPTAVFVTPEVGVVGLTEAQAREKGEVDIYKTRFRAMKATLSGRDEKVLMKIVVDAATDRVLGVHVVGEAAAEMIQLAAIAVRMGATKADFDQTVALHPSAAEELVTLRTKWTPS